MTAAAHLASGMDILRTSLHILGVAVWVGGQIVLAGLVPVLRDAGEGVPQKAARAFARLSWPAFVLVVIVDIEISTPLIKSVPEFPAEATKPLPTTILALATALTPVCVELLFIAAAIAIALASFREPVARVLEAVSSEAMDAAMVKPFITKSPAAKA
ncbi:MAG: hypothetical protein EBR99_04540 [Actinobacteria bacterium]|nr:hypothetical protein [Actinomycetota bacterium]